MCLARLGHQHIFQRLPFLGDLEVAVTLLALEIVVQVDQVLIQARVGQGEFFREDQNVTRHHRLTNALQQSLALLNGDELERIVHDHHAGIVERGIE